jgi:flagellar basal-body rod protein FlgF
MFYFAWSPAGVGVKVGVKGEAAMSQALYTAVQGAYNSQVRLEILTNNLANINTVGFKKDKPYFYLPEAEEKSKNSQAEQGFSISPSAQPYDTRTDFTPSPLRATKNVLDLALEGEGFFVFRRRKESSTRRRGDFSLNQDGKLMTNEGYPVLGKKGEIVLQGKEIAVDESGEISVDGIPVDTLKVVGIEAQHMLKKVSGTLFASQNGEANEKEMKQCKVKQGFLETSGVNGVRAMTEMIDVLRGYESYQKVIQFLSDATRKSINEVGALA